MGTPSYLSSPQRKALEEPLSETLADEELSPSGVTRRLEAGSLQLSTTEGLTGQPLPGYGAESGEPCPDRPGLSNPAPVPLPEETPFDRYVLEGILGRGARGSVYSARDHAFQREVAIKFLHSRDALTPESLGRFIQEGRLAAKLEHPGIAPMYDMDFTKEGEAYLVMRQIRGRSLNEMIEDDAAKELPPSQKDVNQRVNILIRICEAIAFAHSKEIIHRDIKPANIMVGQYGEVIVVDWGTACSEETISSGRARRVGTPLYMSPEQARRESIDARSDIYSLGATLFRLVVGRHAVWADTPESFWDRKQKGELDLPTQQEQAYVTKPLLAIALKAMALDPKNRYESADTFLHDLRSYQDGLAVTAYRDSLWEMLLRWYRRWTHVFWISTTSFLLLLMAGWYIYGEWLKEMASWGTAAVAEDFEDEDWEEDWVVVDGKTGIDNGRLVTTSRSDMHLFYRREISGSVAIEFEGEMTPKFPPGDLSVIWVENVKSPEERRSATRNCYLQTGGRGNTHARIVLWEGRNVSVDVTPFQLVEGRVYRIRAEIDDYSHRLFADGQKLCEYRSLFPMQPGYVGIYGYGAGKAFDNIRIYTKELPEKIGVIAIGDRLFSQGNHSLAIREYRQVENSHRGKPVAWEALYKQGLCYFKMGEKEEAFRVWEGVRDKRFSAWVEFHHLERIADADKPEELLSRIRKLYGQADESLRQAICRLWTHLVGSRRFFPEHSAAFLKLHRDLFPDNVVVREAAAMELVELGHEEEALRTYPEVTEACAEALLRIGRWEELLAKYPQHRHNSAKALYFLGRTEDLLQQYSEDHHRCTSMLISLGRTEEVLWRFPKNDVCQYSALLSLGRFDEIRKRFSANAKLMAAFHNYSGRFEDVIRLYPKERTHVGYAMLHLGRNHEVLAEDTHARHYRARALLGLGRLDEAIRLYPDSLNVVTHSLLLQGEFEATIRRPTEIADVARALVASGRSALARKRFTHRHELQALILLLEGRYEDLLKSYPQQREASAMALVHLGRMTEALRLCSEAYWVQDMGRWRTDLDAFIADPESGLDDSFAGRVSFYQEGSRERVWWNHFPRFLLKPFLLHVVQGKKGLAETYDQIDKDHPKQFSQRLHYAIRFLLGRIDDKAFLAQPVKLYAAADLLLYQGMRSEILKTGKALSHYKAYHSLPAWQKCCNPVVERFVEWRIQQLTSVSPR